MHTQMLVHKTQIQTFLQLHKHHHPNRVGDTKAFRFSVARTFRSSLVRQIYEAVKIYGSQADIVLNSKSEWNQPAIDRIIVTREV